ncbi:MlaD family protein [Pelagibacterium sediminicola]|uniref:MlaD family protein n=1 Tax=Pelagibacterium sediminicola TaxID=2248761 RepID=UPI000E311C73|nr:MlaD family protein [Pelagibacterium sediminicola]
MENKANYALVGAFATLVIAALFGFVYWFSASGNAGPRTPYDVVFTGSVTGLGAGTDVLFNGIKVGDVTGVRIDPEDPNRVIARITVRESTPVMNDTRAVLEIQGLTGMAHIQLLGGTVAAGPVAASAGQDAAILLGEPSDFQLIIEGARDIVASADSTLSRIDTFLGENTDSLSRTIASVENLATSLSALADNVGMGEDSDFSAIIESARSTLEGASATFNRLERFIADNEASLATTIANAETFSGALALNADGLDDFLSTLTDTADRIGPLAEELRNLTTEVRSVVEAVPPEQVRETFSNIEAFSASLARNTGSIDNFFDNADALAGNLSGIADALEDTLSLIDDASEAVDPQVIARAMDNIEAFSVALGDGAPAVSEIIENGRILTESLMNTADRIEAIAGRVDEMVGSDEGETLFSDLALTSQSIRTLAENLDARTTEITNGLTGFANRGLGEYTALANEARGTLRRLDRILANFERNPQLLIFGGQTVRELGQ